MKIDVKVRFVDDGVEETFLCDSDYCSDYDDVIQWVEEEIWNKKKKALHYKVDWDIVNETELCDFFMI